MIFKGNFWEKKAPPNVASLEYTFSSFFTPHILNLAQAVASCLAGKHPSNLNQAGSCDQALTLEQYCHYNPFFYIACWCI